MKLDTLVHWYNTLTPETIPAVREIYHEKAHFHDPFNNVHGHEAIVGVFRRMFETTQNPVFHIRAVQKDGNTAWVSWIFDFWSRDEALSIDGVSRLDFGADGRVIAHRDYWDATDLLVELPLLGRILRFLRNRLRAPEKPVVGKKANP